MTVTISANGEEQRLLWPAISRGMACRCPKCGEGKLFRAYLKVADACPACGEEFHHHRADDLPPYLAIVIVGHILVGTMLHLEMAWHVDPFLHLIIMLPLAVALPLAMLPSIKGGVVALQWAYRMHGFGGSEEEFEHEIEDRRGRLGYREAAATRDQ